jgi:hypothetical protein
VTDEFSEGGERLDFQGVDPRKKERGGEIPRGLDKEILELEA